MFPWLPLKSKQNFKFEGVTWEENMWIALQPQHSSVYFLLSQGSSSEAGWFCVLSPSLDVLWAVSCGRDSVVSSVCSSIPWLPSFVLHISLHWSCWRWFGFFFFSESAVFHQAAVGPWIPGNMVHGGWSSEVVLSCQQCKIMKMGPSHTVGWSGTTCLRAQLRTNCFSSSSNTVSTTGRSGAWKLPALLWAPAQDSGTENAQNCSHRWKVYSFFPAEKSYKSSSFTSLSLFQMIGSGPTRLMSYVNLPVHVQSHKTAK